MKLKSSLLILGLCGAVSMASAATIEITGFGNGQFEQLAAFGADVQDATSYSISGSDGGSTLVGALAVPFQFVGQPDLVFVATLTFTTNPASAFQIGMYDAEGNGLLYNANWSSFTTSGQVATLTLSYATSDLGGDGSFSGQVTNFVLATNGTGLATINLKLDSIGITSAIPEPSTYAALVGLATVGFVVTRRRRSV